MNKEIIQKAIDNIRIFSASMVEQAKSGHPGGSIGAADFMAVLFGEFLEFDPDQPTWMSRDRYYQDPGHMSPLLYSTLSLCGKYSMEDLAGFRSLGTHTPGHPEVDFMRGVENTSGPLGMGHAIAMGSAIAERFLAARFGKIVEHKTYSLISDGGVQEEIAYGVGRLAGHLKLSNFIMYYDANDVQISGSTQDVIRHEVVRPMYEAWGWKVYEVDGHNQDEIRAALTKAKAETEAPTLIIGKSVIAKGVVDADGNPFEGKASTHGQPISAAGGSFEKTVESLGGNPEDPFKIFPEVEAAFATRLDELREVAAKWQSEKKDWDSNNPELSKTLDKWLSGDAPAIDYEELTNAQADNKATRVYSGNVLAKLAHTGNMVCSSADLACSDNTQGFLDETGIFTPGDFSGAFLQPGVAELTMAAACNGIALHGGVVPVCATFFVFSDYMKPAVRMATLMQLPVKYVWSHDSFRVGEDGPTHQPVEHELQIRLMERMRNLEGEPGMMVLRPADGAETVVSWKMAMENKERPTALILTRQGLKDLPVYNEGQSRYEAALQADKGAYIVSDNTVEGEKHDIIFLANGSEVYLCEQTAEMLREKGYKVRVNSMISPNLFNEQSAEYRAQIIPEVGPCFGVTSGLPLMFIECVGPLGKVFGLRGFGASASFKVLEEEFGYTPDQLFARAEEFIKEYPKAAAKLKSLL